MHHIDEYINNIQCLASAPFTDVIVSCIPLPFFWKQKREV